MPLYEYQCERCGHRFERIQKFSDPPVETCPLDGAPVKKLPSSPAIQFKGSGWYITDYPKSRPSGETKPGASKESSSESGGDSTPPAKESKESKDSKDSSTSASSKSDTKKE